MTTEQPPWEKLFEIAPVAISVIDAHGRQVACNDAYADLLGYRADELVDSDVGRVTRPSDQEWTRSYLTQLTSGEIDEFITDKTYVRKDGSELVARLTARAIREPDGSCSYLAAAIVPVDEAPPVSRGRTHRLLEFTTDSLTVLDLEGNVLETTGRHVPVLGYPPEFWNTRSVFDLVADHDAARISELRDRLLSSPDLQIDTEIEVRAADGAIETLQVTATNCIDDPDIAGIVLSTRNVTEHLRTFADLLRRRDTAEAVADAQTRLLATVSHELRNPLHAVQGLAELLSEEDLPPGASELAETLRRQLVSLTQVAQDLLDAARLDAGAVKMEPQAVPLRALVDDVVAVGAAAVGERPVRVSGQVSPDSPDWVTVDGGRLRQILVNLVGNAVKFTEAGSVELIVRPDTDEAVRFDVVDTGVGVPEDELELVLEPFRVASTGGGGRGAGLGLSIVQRLVAAMHGRVSMTSEVGVGTRVGVVLPLSEAQPPRSAISDAPVAGRPVLVVEDNPVNQQLAQNQLERLGLVPTVVGSGEEALELLDTDVEFDVVLMDHQLPGISGLETTRRIRERDDERASMAVVGLSASASAADADAFLAAGMDDFVAKPASLQDLSTAIARAQSIDRAVTSDSEPSADDANRFDDDRSDDDDLDLAVIEALVSDLGDRSLVVTLIETFLGELDDRMSAMTGRDAPDAEEARRAAHTLKSSARLLGATRLADACAAIERGEHVDADVDVLASMARSRMRGWLAAAPIDEPRNGGT